MSKTIQETIVFGLIKLGWKQTETRANYLAFFNPQFDLKLFVGSKGALRAGKNATNSHSIGCPMGFQNAYYKKVLEAGKTN